MTALGIDFQTVFVPDRSVPDAYAVNAVPSYIILDSSGRIAHEIRGAWPVEYINRTLLEVRQE